MSLRLYSSTLRLPGHIKQLICQNWLSLKVVLTVLGATLSAAQGYSQVSVPPEKSTPALSASTELTTPPVQGPWLDRKLTAERRAELLLAAMTRDEKLLLLRGFSGGFVGGRSKDPLIGPVQRMTSGYVPGVPRLGIPALHVNDASIGVANGYDANPAR